MKTICCRAAARPAAFASPAIVPSLRARLTPRSRILHSARKFQGGPARASTEGGIALDEGADGDRAGAPPLRQQAAMDDVTRPNRVAPRQGSEAPQPGSEA